MAGCVGGYSQKKGIDFKSVPDLRSLQKKETISHPFLSILTCPLSSGVIFCRVMSLSGVLPDPVGGKDAWVYGSFQVVDRLLRGWCLLLSFLLIWKERNDWIFNSRKA